MTETEWFCLLWLGRGGAHISCDIRGKGEWCGLTDPTFITQWYNFEGIHKPQHTSGGRVWFEQGSWHHVALTVTAPDRLDVYLGRPPQIHRPGHGPHFPVKATQPRR